MKIALISSRLTMQTRQSNAVELEGEAIELHSLGIIKGIKVNIMDLLKPEQIYHLSCSSCGSDWWDDNPFPSYCPYCNTNRVPEREDNKEEH